MTDFVQCDCCGRLTDRLHHGVACGTDTSACDECCGYEAEAYGEAPAEYAEEGPGASLYDTDYTPGEKHPMTARSYANLERI